MALTTQNTNQLTRNKVMAKKPMKAAPKFTPCKGCPTPAKCKAMGSCMKKAK